MAFSDDEKIDLLLKKSFGKVSTSTGYAIYQEPVDARSNIYTSQIFQQDIPITNPNDFEPTYTSSDAKNVIATSASYPYLKYYHKWDLIMILEGNDQAFKGKATTDTTNVLMNSIPFSYGKGYTGELYKNDNSPIAFGTGKWVIDSDGGVLTFHDHENISGVLLTSPPKISFYRYEGVIGSALKETKIISDSIDNSDSKTFIYPSLQDRTLVLRDAIGDHTWDGVSNNKLEIVGAAHIEGAVTAKSLITYSDRNLKTDVTEITNSLEKLKKLNGVSFKWKKTNETSHGIIAQDLEDVLPLAVNTNKSTGYKSVNYNAVIAILVESMKTLESKYNELESKYNELESKYN